MFITVFDGKNGSYFSYALHRDVKESNSFETMDDDDRSQSKCILNLIRLVSCLMLLFLSQLCF